MSIPAAKTLRTARSIIKFTLTAKSLTARHNMSTSSDPSSSLITNVYRSQPQAYHSRLASVPPTMISKRCLYVLSLSLVAQELSSSAAPPSCQIGAQQNAPTPPLALLAEPPTRSLNWRGKSAKFLLAHVGRKCHPRDSPLPPPAAPPWAHATARRSLSCRTSIRCFHSELTDTQNIFCVGCCSVRRRPEPQL